jgi:hypothetical protein
MAEDIKDEGQQRDVASTNWAALESDVMFTDLTEEAKQTEIKSEEGELKDPETPEGEEKEGEIDAEKTEESKEEGEKEGEEVEGEKNPEGESGKKEGEEEAQPFIEFKAEDVQGLEKEPEDGTWAALAKAQGVEIQEESFEAYQAAVESKYSAEIEKVKQATKETIFADLKPETVAALKLIEMGVPEENVFAPTKAIDQYLQMDDAALIREDLKLRGWDDEKIDTELEILTEKNWIEHEAAKLRDVLENEKESITAKREEILKEYSENKEKISLKQQEEQVGQLKKALDTVSSFMNGKISPEAKEVIWQKYTKGAYEKELNDPQSRIEFLLYKEFGARAIKHLENTAYQRGREEKTKKLLNIPPIKEGSAGTTKEPKQINQWSALEDFED